MYPLSIQLSLVPLYSHTHANKWPHTTHWWHMVDIIMAPLLPQNYYIHSLLDYIYFRKGRQNLFCRTLTNSKSSSKSSHNLMRDGVDIVCCAPSFSECKHCFTIVLFYTPYAWYSDPLFYGWYHTLCSELKNNRR